MDTSCWNCGAEDTTLEVVHVTEHNTYTFCSLCAHMVREELANE